jgi:hypothetical protein
VLELNFSSGELEFGLGEMHYMRLEKITFPRLAFEQLNERSEVWKDSDKATTFIERMLCNSQRGD